MKHSVKTAVLSLMVLMPTSVFCQQTMQKAIYFKKVFEPNEKAFELLVPVGWQTKGGIYRVNPTQAGGAAQSIAAKNDFAVFNNESADVMIRWLPDNLFIDMRGTPAAAMFPPGSNNNGMTVLYKTDPVSFILQVGIPYAHPNASNILVLNKNPLPGIAKAYYDEHLKSSPMLTMSYTAARLHYEYYENGKAYEEIMITVLEDWGTMGAGMWGNKSSLLIRAPKGELKEWAAILETIQNSIKIDINWFVGELRGQQYRAGKMIEVQQEIRNIDKEIVEHQQKVNYEINNDMYLNFTGQEEYINPFNGEVEMGTNNWKYRWQNDLGEIIYTDRGEYDPNTDINLNVSGFKRSEIRKR